MITKLKKNDFFYMNNILLEKYLKASFYLKGRKKVRKEFEYFLLILKDDYEKTTKFKSNSNIK